MVNAQSFANSKNLNDVLAPFYFCHTDSCSFCLLLCGLLVCSISGLCRQLRSRSSMSHRQCPERHVLLDVWQKLRKQCSGREALCMVCPVCLLQVTSKGRCKLSMGWPVHLCNPSYRSCTPPTHFTSATGSAGAPLSCTGWAGVWLLQHLLSGTSICSGFHLVAGMQQAVNYSLIWVPRQGPCSCCWQCCNLKFLMPPWF